MELERRDFLKGAALGAFGIASVGALGACAPSAERSDANAAQAAETNGAADGGESNEAVWRTPPSSIAEKDIAETKQADYVVVGCGFAGAAVIRSIADEESNTVIGIDKQVLENYFTMGNDVGHFNSQFLRDHSVADVDPVEMYNDWMRRTLNAANPALIMQYCQNCGSNIDWWLSALADETVSALSVAFSPAPEHSLSNVAGFKFLTGTLRAQVDATSTVSLGDVQKEIFEEILAHDNASLDFATTACQLVKEGDRVVAVIAQNAEGAYVKYEATKGVVLAAGDFASNESMRNDLLTHITDCFQEGRSAWSEAIMGQDGSGIQMGYWAGGRIEPRPLATMNGEFGKGSYPQTIWLDTNGERYCNEFFSDCTMSGKPQARLAHVDTFAVSDATILDHLSYCIPAHDAFEPSEANMAFITEVLTQAMGTGAEGFYYSSGPQGNTIGEKTDGPAPLYCAETLDELADYMGYDSKQKTAMLAQVDRWNAMCENGRDEEFGKDPEVMFPIATPPYYAFRCTPSAIGGIMVSLGGLMTDKHQNVLDDELAPIEGLYATGNCCGRRFGNGYFTQMAGASLGIAITLGRELGKHLIAN
ncbi:FAD-binding protein [Eggerthella sinensis]|uniref:FAD-dependent oxidoreductase 2 FAD-binding domain-containing protein n=1 Tax=Eggerthella sinensis TaxID=242230 RepID=A0A3N0IXA5_9ACTN|nr:FAD-binding protein [Eggerthella sinensis]RDB65470.1 hypothetical protein C1876_15405 [Eggerthella sinensis]RNM41639.1 hypothetical protein DMP09_08875 [Eggerthella sinensis]